MKLTKFFLMGVMLIVTGVCAVSCGDDDDEPDFKKEAVAGSWKCVDADVLSIDVAGFELPDMIKEMLIERVESSLEGEVVTIDPSKVRFDGNVMIFKDSGISWHITDLTDNRMEVVYDTDNTYQQMSLKMKVEAEYVKIKP